MRAALFTHPSRHCPSPRKPGSPEEQRAASSCPCLAPGDFRNQAERGTTLTGRAISSGLGQAGGPAVTLTQLRGWLCKPFGEVVFAAAAGMLPGWRTGTVLSTPIPSRKPFLRAFTHPFCHAQGAAPPLCCKASPGCYLAQEGRQNPGGFASGVSQTRLATGYSHHWHSLGQNSCVSARDAGRAAVRHT